MIDYGNKLVETVGGFVDAVSTILLVYNNLETERSHFFSKSGVQLQDGAGKPRVREVKTQYGLREIVANIGNNRNTLKEIASTDSVIKGLVAEVMDHSYTLSEVILMNLFVSATLLTTDEFREKSINLEDLEGARVELAKQIREDPMFERLRPRVRTFYLGRGKITDIARSSHQ